MTHTHDGQPTKADENYGSGDPILPYAIGVAVVCVLLIAMHTVGHKMSIGTTLAFILDGLWFFWGVFLVLIWPIFLWVPMNRRHKWSKMFFSILGGIAYFAVSGMLMAVLPRMN